MYYNVHTHHHTPRPDVLSIENRYQGFDEKIAGRKVSFGLHPWYLNAETIEKQWESLISNVNKEEVLAVGECGLDKLTGTDWSLQLNVFRRQILLAQELEKPLIIHCVKAFSEILFELKNVTLPVVFHGVNKKRSVIQPVIDAGHYLSFGKTLSGRQEYIVDTFNAVPLNRIFLETDDADIDIQEIYKSAAEIKDLSEKEIVLQLEKNFLNIFH